MSALITPERAILWLSQTPVILSAIVRDVDQARAVSARDGADGWNVLEILCHLNDLEAIYIQRTQQIIETDAPNLIPFNHLDAVTANNYAGQNFADVLAQYLERRKEHLALLKGLSADQWAREGTHVSYGANPLAHYSTTTALHDVNHIEQITRALSLA